MAHGSDVSVSALLVGAYPNDRLQIRDIFRQCGWQLFEARTRRKALECLERNRIQVVLVETTLDNWNWKDVLRQLRKLVPAPQLIVTSVHADDYLWAEALNVGAFDVLLQPFQRDEVERVVLSARRHYNPRHLNAVPAYVSASVA
jgi:DNA-binding response OmpR family regulator